MATLSLCLLAPYCRAQQEAATWKQINEAFGLQLLADELLWNDDDAQAAARMQLPRESRTSNQASFRSYPRESTMVLGTRPYSIALYSEGGAPRYISMAFMNKGDYPGFIAAKEMKFRSKFEADKHWRSLAADFDAALKLEGESIHATLTGLLGEPKRGSFGQSGRMKERVDRWDWNGHAVLLTITPGEYVTLRIMPPGAADAHGKGTGSASDKELGAVLKQRVERRDNGDVVVTDIPMVNQGPKGYCVPATWERYLRYMGIPADMYVLAMAAETGRGGGTSVEAIIEAVTRLVRRNNRQIRSMRPKITVREVARSIDDGLPLMWTMHVVPQLNDEISRRTASRRAAKDAATWRDSLKSARGAARQLKSAKGYGHVCMIIGYNPVTGEIAISDSWGEAFAERWITVEEADAISGERLLQIDL